MGKVPSNWGHDWDISNEGAKSLYVSLGEAMKQG